MTASEGTPTPAAAPLRPLYITAGAASVFSAAYAALALPPNGIAGLFITYGPVISMVMWMRTDARVRRVGVVFDWGFLALVTWPILTPWYVFSTRGKAGWPLLGKLVAAIVAPWMAAFVAHMIGSVVLGTEAGA